MLRPVFDQATDGADGEMSIVIDSGLSHAQRSQLAETAWSDLPHGGHDAVRLRVQCRRGHHVAALFATPAGLVYVAPIRGHSHGAHDLPDQPHRDQQPHRWFDFIAESDPATTDDALPAWCDCGHRALSRATVLRWLGAGEHRVVID